MEAQFHKDFYPTPKHTATRMFAKLEKPWEAKNVLDPSAGMGGLLELFREFLKTRHRSCSADMDAIEINETCRKTLIGKNINLVDSDFLQYNGYKHYDLIIANYPFSEGAKHLNKSLDILTCGQLVGLVNASTIKNPKTNEEVALSYRLKEMGAQIDFWNDEFINSDRPTRVEVACIYVKVESDLRDVLCHQLEEDKADGDIDLEGDNCITIKDDIGNLVKQYLKDRDNLQNLVIDFYRNFNMAKDYLHLSIIGEGQKDEDRELPTGPELTAIVKLKLNQLHEKLKGDYWERVLKIDGFKEKLPSVIQGKFYRYFDSFKKMEFSESNIRQFGLNIMTEFPNSVEEAIDYMFDKMTSHALSAYDKEDYLKNIHYYNGWKTNSAYRVGKKVILPFYSHCRIMERQELNWEQERLINDLSLIASYFGKPCLHKTGEELDDLLRAKISNKIENDFFKFTAYKKGTLHIEFKNEDILRWFNIEAGKRKNFLPFDYAEKDLCDMSPEELKLAESFEGSLKQYSKVPSLKKTIAPANQNLLLLSA